MLLSGDRKQPRAWRVPLQGKMMKIPPPFNLIVALCMMARAEGSANLNAIELNDLFTLLEKARNQEPPKEERVADAEDPAEGEMPLVPAIPTGHVRGSERSLYVPNIEASGAIIEKTSIKNMPPTLIEVDGKLNDALWKKAAVSGNFWCSFENKPPTDPTEVWIARDATYLYFGVFLHDSEPTKIEASKTVRDVWFGFDDSITVELDPFFNRRDISSFSLNPFGTQSDEIAGGRSSRIQWKGDWLGAAERTDTGWSAEFAIPFAILNYQQKSTVFGVNFKRYQNRTKECSWWADITPQAKPEEMGRLRGLDLPEATKSRKQQWTLMPYVLAGKNIPDKEGNIQDTLVTGGVDIRYQPRPDLTGVISLNPDFSQVEKDFTDISFSYNEKRVKDNRPFFVEGQDYFSDDDDEYFYSSRAADFDYGVKSFGKAGQTKFGVLATSAPNDRYDGAGQVLYELSDTHSAIVTGTATRQDAFRNGLAVAQIEGRESWGLKYSADAAITQTTPSDPAAPVDGAGSHLKGLLGWKADYWYINGDVDRYDVDYFPALGLLDDDLPGTQSINAITGFYREQSKYFWRVIDSYAGIKHRETLEGMLQNEKWFAGGSVEFENQIRTSAYAEQGPYRPVTDIRGEFAPTTNDDEYYSLAIDFNTRSSVFSCGSIYDWGQLGGGDYQHAKVHAWLRPVSVLLLESSYEITEIFGTYKQAIVNGSWEITPENSLSARYIYYEDDYVSDNYYRVAYGRKARNGLDVFVVYDNDPYLAEQYSIKLVYAF